MRIEVYFKDKVTKTEHHLGYFSLEREAEADKLIKDSEKLSKVWETEKRYSYHKRKVD